MSNIDPQHSGPIPPAQFSGDIPVVPPQPSVPTQASGSVPVYQPGSADQPWQTNGSRPSPAVPGSGSWGQGFVPAQPVYYQQPDMKSGAQPMYEPPRVSEHFSAPAPLTMDDGQSGPPSPRFRMPKLSWKPWMTYTCIGLGLILVIMIASGISNSVREKQAREALVKSVTDYDDRFCPGVYVDGVALGGMTQQQAMDAIQAHSAQELSGWSVQLVYEGQTQAVLDAASLGVTISMSDALSEAWSKGHVGDVDQRRAEMDELQQTPFYAYTVQNEVDQSVLSRKLEALATALYVAPVDASLAMFDAARTNPFVFNQEVPGRQLDLEGLQQTLTEMLRTKTSGTVELQST